MLQTVRAGISHKWNAWVRRRIPAKNEVELDERSIFILPTREGWIFIVSLMFMFIGGVNYENSLVLGLTFFLTGLLLVTILQTFNNLYGISLSSAAAEPGFLDEFVMYSILVKSKQKSVHESIELSFPGYDVKTVSVLPGETTQVQLFIPAARRGVQRPGRLRVQTRFPLGLLVAWSWVDLQLESLVYPKPLNGPQPLQNIAVDELDSEITSPGSGDFVGLNAYQAGDQLSRVYWKVLARGMPLATKSFEQPLSTSVWLSRGAITGDLEYQLQILVFWVLQFSQAQTPFGLDLGMQRIPINSGPVHKRTCLEALALFGLAQPGGEHDQLGE